MSDRLLYNEMIQTFKTSLQNTMTPVVIKPSSWLTTGIRVEKINNLNLFKFTEKLGDRMKELLEKKKADLLTPEEAAELEAIGELDTIFSYINAVIASQP